MNIIKLSILAVVFVFSVALQPVYAAKAGDVVIVDIQKVIDESSAAKNIRSQIKSKRDGYQKKITSEEEKLRKTDQKLSEERSLISPEAFNEKRKEFKTKLIEVQRDVQAKRSLLDESYKRAMGKVHNEVVSIIEGMSKEKGFKVAIAKSQALYSEDGLEITEEVLAKLNKRLPKVKVSIKDK